MNRSSLKSRIGKASAAAALIVAILLFSLAFLWTGERRSTQADPSTVAGVSFAGEYRIGDGEWRDVVKGEHISATRGDVTLRGIFLMHDPTDGSPVGPLSPGTTVNLYFNHLGGYAILPEGAILPFDTENESFGEDACAAAWGSVPATGDRPITIVLQNPHVYGNENAVDEFFEHMSIAPGIYLESLMLAKGETQRTVGLFILICSLIVLGIAVFSTVIHVKASVRTWLIGLTAMSAGGYLLFHSFAVSIWNTPNIVNTRMLGLCMMFYLLFVSMLVVTMLEGRLKRIARAVTALSAATMVCCISLSFLECVKFYDTWPAWIAIELAVLPVLTLCLILSFKGSSRNEKYTYVTAIAIFAAFYLDVFATAFGLWEGGFISEFAFFAAFFIALVAVLRIIPASINAAIRARELEAEQQALKLELQENRISIMLSQMQPHFIFNTLNTIYHLCEINPDKARSTINAFSDYLRNNIDNLEQSEMISFEKELSFVKTYLDIEKVRFDDELLITFDIGVTNFKLPVLTVEPIVENAVKHGTSKKEGVSSLFLSTRETDTHYEIEIRDTGVGFDANSYNDDGHRHIGISNVRQRLKNLCNGTLTIESVCGEGTTATIKIPKNEVPGI